tara:strand:+ start:6058 stop:7044 length:987 start_codon:yes stop_codon:yes gene_type:complete
MSKFDRGNFFFKKKTLRCNNFIGILKKNLINHRLLNNFEILDVSSLSRQIKNSVLFLDKDVNISKINFNLNLVITNSEEIFKNKKLKDIFYIKNIKESWNTIINEIYSHEDSLDYIDEFIFINNSYISKDAKVDKSAKIFNNCVIGKGVEIGKNCIIKNNVVIKNSLIRDNVVICDNSSIGTTGFGFDTNKRGSAFINPQIGIVTIEDNVHIGSSCTIDRGKIDSTYIGKNTMIDNMVHIAHNVQIGKNACIAAQTGISGSVIIGDNVTVGGQVGFAGHINIGKNVIVAAKSGVTKNISDNSIVAGFPAVDIKEWKRKIIREKKNGHK